MNTLKLIPLGGVGDVTKNMYVYEYGDDQFIIDCGIGFPRDSALGVDFVIPDISYLEKSPKKLHGIIISHGHMDHLGGLPYILPRLPKDLPVYGAPLAAALAEARIREFGLTNPVRVMKDALRFGSLSITPIHITHSTPQSRHLFITSPAGNVYHGADFKFDLTPLDNQPADFAAIAKASSAGVDLMLTDCLRIEQDGFTPSEQTLLPAMDQVFGNAKGKIIFTTMSSSISRMQMAIDSSIKYQRKVALLGRSVKQNIESSIKCGLMKLPPNTLIESKKVSGLPPEKVTIIAAGAQGQEGSALHRLAADEHQFIKLKPKDHVVISGDAIPGNEGDVFGLIDTLYQSGISVTYSGTSKNLHVSGHGSKGDLALLARLVRPKSIVPIGGNIRHMVLYRDLAETMGYHKDDVHILEDGQTVVIENHKVFKGSKVETKNVYVDGLGIGDVGTVVLRDRQVMAEDGILLAIVPIRHDNSQIAGDVEIISRGFVYMKESKDLLKKSKQKVVDSMRGAKRIASDWSFLRKKIEQNLEQFLYEQTERRPLIIAVLLEV